MPQTEQDLEEGSNPDGPVDGHRDQPQSILNRTSPPLSGEFDYGDSSRPLYSMYCKIAEVEDKKVVDNLQKDIDGTLIFTGLFAATVGALLTVSIPDLKPNSQDTSAFYLEKIYQLQAFGNPNVSHPSVPSALAKPPAFSPPRYAIWVNSLWFLSLVVSLWAAVMAMLCRDWTLGYNALSQPPRYGNTSEIYARRHAILAKGQFRPYIVWGIGHEAIYLHFSLLLFIAGGLIYLFNINSAVFYAVVWWVGYMTISYAIVTAAGFFKTYDLFHTPLSLLALRIYLVISYAVFQVCSYLPPLHGLRDNTRKYYHDLSDRYGEGFLTGKLKAIVETASKPSSEIDDLILERILPNLDEDHALEACFDAIPGYCNSNLTDLPLSSRVQRKLRQSLDGFLNRTFSSSLIPESDRTRRLITCLHAACAALSPYEALEVSEILDNIFDGHWDEALQFVENWDALKPCGLSRNHDLSVRQIAVACIIPRVYKRNDRWIKLVKETLGVPDSVLDYPAYGDSVLLSILIHISRQINRGSSLSWRILSPLSKFDIRNTRPELQLDFCVLWNEIAQDAQNQRSFKVGILRQLRHVYIALHQGTDASPAAFSSSTPSHDRILFQPSSYPLCDIASHYPDSTTHFHVTNSPAVPISTQPGGFPSASPFLPSHCGSTDPQLAEQANIIVGLPLPSNQTATSEVGGTCHAPIALPLTNPIHSGPRPTDASPPGVATALQDIPPSATLSHPLDGTTQRDIVTPCAEPDVREVLSIASTPAPTPTLAPVTAYTPPVLSECCDAGAASTPNPLLPVSSVVGFSIPASPPSRVPPLPDAEFLALPSSTTVAATPPRPTSNATLSRPRVHGLANSGSMYFANAMLQLLVHSPPFWNLFRELGDLKGQRGAGDVEADDGATPLVDATLRFFEESRFMEPLPMQQPAQQAARGKPREDEEAKKHDAVDSFEPMYLYDAMKEKRKLKDLLDGQQQDAEEFFRLYLDALDEELRALLASISGHKSAAVTPGVEDREVSQSDLTDVGFMASSAESPISRIFDGRSRSTIRAPNQPDSITIQDWRLLQLNIQPDLVHTVKDALAHISQPQPVQVGQLSPSEVTQQVQIEELPPVLVLHLKRFLYDAAADGIVKINKPVQFAPELEIPLEIMAPVTRKSAEPVHYKLYGVLYHHGESAGNGHYTVDVLHPNGDSGSEEAWLHIDDEAVSAVRHEDVFEGHENERVDDWCAYMLFYCRTTPAWT